MRRCLAALLAIAATTPAAADPADCKQFLTGTWVAKGVVTEFGPPVEVDNTYDYDPDGTFRTHNRYRGQDGKWAEQKIAGRWKASPGKVPGGCVLELTSTPPGGSSSSTSEIQLIGKDTFRSLGFDAKRVRK